MADSIPHNRDIPARSPALNPARRAAWLKTLHQWHWISSAICLLGMLLFSFTGITLNHAAQIEAKPQVTSLAAVLPARYLTELVQFADAHDGSEAPLPDSLRHWLRANWSVDPGSRPAEWSADEVYLPLPRPGGDAWLRIGLADGKVEYEVTTRGWISYANDLHKGRHTGAAWNWFIDLFAAACLVFSLSGLLILKFHAASRPSTWPVVGLGVVVPVLIALLFIH
ncbi:MAG: PepSY-associated TM helix domain-containing protein [Actinomycetota bacterium]